MKAAENFFYLKLHNKHSFMKPKYLAFSIYLFDMTLQRAAMEILDFSDVVPLVFHQNTNPKPFSPLKMDIYAKYVPI